MARGLPRSRQLLSLKRVPVIEVTVRSEKVDGLYDGLDRAVKSALVRKNQNVLGLAQAIVNANKQLKQAKKSYLAGSPLSFFFVLALSDSRRP